MPSLPAPTCRAPSDHQPSPKWDQALKVAVMRCGTCRSLVSRVGFYTLITAKFERAIWTRQVSLVTSQGRVVLTGNSFKHSHSTLRFLNIFAPILRPTRTVGFLKMRVLANSLVFSMRGKPCNPTHFFADAIRTTSGHVRHECPPGGVGAVPPLMFHRT